MGFLERMKNAWNAFSQQEMNPPMDYGYTGGMASYGGSSPSRPPRRFQNERSIVTAIYTRISMDVAAVSLKHIQLDGTDRFKQTVDSQLNHCLVFEPNLDQGPRAFRQDIIQTLFDSGAAAIVPVDSTVNPDNNEVFDIYSMRVGEITQWFPDKVKVNLYNEKKMVREQVVLEKRSVAIVENPFYNVMNQPNSTMQRLIAKLNLLDVVDEQSSSGKLDLIIQLPYVIKGEARKKQAEERRTDIEMQLKGSKYGIAYTDGTEHITQLNRPTTNNLLEQIDYLTKMLYGQLGITEEVMNGTADEKTMINYRNRTLLPLVEAIKEAMQRSFLRTRALTDNEQISYFMNPFALTPLNELAMVADKFSRNEIITPNELRGFMGLPPSPDPRADKLINSNMPARPGDPNAPAGAPPTTGGSAPPAAPSVSVDDMNKIVGDTFDGMSQDIDSLVGKPNG